MQCSEGSIKKYTTFAIQYRGMEQLAARWAHNPKVVGSSPTPATKLVPNQLYFNWLGIFNLMNVKRFVKR